MRKPRAKASGSGVRGFRFLEDPLRDRKGFYQGLVFRFGGLGVFDSFSESGLSV